MKKTIKSTVSLLLVIICLFSLAACGNTADKAKNPSEEITGLWKDATYLEDTTLGDGEKTVVVEVEAEEKTITFTIETDEKTVGAALLEHKLIDGDQGEYGLYVKKVNGMTADYDVDKSYWAFYVDNEYASSGVDTTEITEGAKYKLAHQK